VGLEQAIEPCGASFGVGWRAGNDGHEFGDRAIDGAADRTGRAVDVLQRWRDAFEQRDRAGTHAVLRMRYADARDASRKSTWIDDSQPP
jgi:hypothetical protein